MKLDVSEIIRKHYSDFLVTSCVSAEEVQELVTLFGIIASELPAPAPDYEHIVDVLTEAGVQIVPSFDIAEGTEGTEGTEARGLIQSLHARELPGEQRSELWLQQRVKYITASVSAACAGLMGKASRENQVLEKASNGTFRSFKGGYYTDIGNIFEDVTNSYYCHVHNTRIHEFSLIPHYKEEFRELLGASTDGVSSELINIEIKTLPGRTPNGKVKKEYYHQTQHQMECLGLKMTDFLEAKYNEYPCIEDLEADSQTDDCRGIILELYNLSDNCYEYQYSPVINPDIARLKQWQDSRDSVVRDYDDRLFTRWIYWKQTAYLCTRIDYDPKWIVTMGPLHKEFDKDVRALRANPKKLQQMIRDRDLRIHNRRNAGNTLFTDCML